jgi:hypothetical protein
MNEYEYKRWLIDKVMRKVKSKMKNNTKSIDLKKVLMRSKKSVMVTLEPVHNFKTQVILLMVEK